MPTDYMAPYLSFNYLFSGGKDNSNPLASLGGVMSNHHAFSKAMFLTSITTPKTGVATTYQALFVLNNTDSAIKDIKASLTREHLNISLPNQLDSFEIGYEQAVNQNGDWTIQTIADINTEPNNITWIQAGSKDNPTLLSSAPIDAGAPFGLWIKRTWDKNLVGGTMFVSWELRISADKNI